MKKTIISPILGALPSVVKTTRVKRYGCIAIVLLAGCTATQVRWDATNIRKEVMVYYNDQIMDNLIRAEKHLPFVHVDITLLTSQGSSQISGTIGAGETQAHTDSGPIGALNMLSKVVTRPFSYSATPQQTETLSIQAAPALGSLALATPTPAKSPTPTPTPEVTKITEVRETTKPGESPKPVDKTTTEYTPIKPTFTIYDLYEHFAERYLRHTDGLIHPTEQYVPGTLKRWGEQCYYYIPKDNKKAYYDFCKELFTKGQATSLEKALLRTEAAAALH